MLSQQRAADLLLLYVAPGRGSQGVYTGKVFEYVAARRPVLALSPVGNVASVLLEESGATSQGGGARVDPDDVDAIAAALLAAWQRWRDAGGTEGAQVPDVSTPDSLMARIDRADAARRLADVLFDARDRGVR